jgi:hypothetical protein
MLRFTVGTLLFLLVGCSGTPPPRQFSVCSTHPGSFDCQIERMSRAGS